MKMSLVWLILMEGFGYLGGLGVCDNLPLMYLYLVSLRLTEKSLSLWATLS